MNKPKILVIDDEEGIRFTFNEFLTNEGYAVVTAKNFQEALSRIAKTAFDLIFADIFLGDKTGIDVLEKVKAKDLNCPVVIFSAAPSIKTASKAVRLGAFDYITKPIEKNKLLTVARNALRHKFQVDEKEKHHSSLETIFRSVKDAIITVDKELTVIEINDAAKNICGLASKSVIGKKLNLSQKRCNGKCLESLVKTIKTKKQVEAFRLRCGSKNRPGQIVNLVSYPTLDSKNLFSGAVLVVGTALMAPAVIRGKKEKDKRFQKIISKSQKMEKIFSLIEKLANVPATVLIQGDSGTGKELVAEELHNRGSRKDKLLVKVNCSTLTENLLESELFGHVKGAFTGAIENKVGRFQLADGGTIFLDEIGDISPHTQLRLLRVLQNQEFERVGSSTPIKADVRVLTATNQDLSEMVRLGQFREDLYYRVKVVQIDLPPLRARLEDIPLLVEHFLKKYNKKFEKQVEGISVEVIKKFMHYSWPGNVRELEHTLEHAIIFCSKPIITIENLPPDFSRSFAHKADLRNKAGDPSLAILQALENSGWNKSKAALLLGISRQTLYENIKKYKIEPEL